MKLFSYSLVLLYRDRTHSNYILFCSYLSRRKNIRGFATRFRIIKFAPLATHLRDASFIFVAIRICTIP